MKTKQNIDILLENGIHFSTLSTMTESQIRVLAEKAKKSKKKDLCPCGCEKDNCPCGPDCKKCDCGKSKSKKKETKEATTKQVSQTTMDKTEWDTFMKKGGAVTGTVKQEDDGSVTITNESTESQELDEKFKSKAQQKLFFMKCGDGKTKEQKMWCKLRDEFASDTTKRDYKTMPDYVDDEKPKRKTRKKPTSKKRRSTKKESYEKQLEDKIVEMIDNHINPAMTKGKLINTINEKKNESFILRNPKKVTMFSDEEGIESKGRRKKMKLPIGRITSLGMMEEDLEEDTKTAPTKDPGTKERTKKPGRRNPFKRPGPKEKPRAGENEKQKSDFMSLIKQVLNMS
jgi:hypothetical protein